MLIAIALATSLSLGQDPLDPPIFPKLFPFPTGNNGYEEYVLAGDLIDELGLKFIYYDPAGPDSTSWYDKVRVQVAGTERVMALVRQGNAKPVSNPLEHEGLQRLELEYIPFIYLGNQVRQHAKFFFAIGEPHRALQICGDLRTLGQNLMSCGGFSNYMTGRRFAGVADRLYYEFRRMIPIDVLHELSTERRQDSLVELFRQVDASLAQIPPEIDAYRRDPDAWGAFMSDIFFGTRSAEWSELGDVEWRAVRADTLAALRRARQIWLSLEGVPFGEVLQRLNREFPAGLVRHEDKTGVDAILEFPHRMMIAAVMRVTKGRLLQLHLSIEEFRRLHGRLPASLSELGDEGILQDPLSGSVFIYERADRDYRLYSSGDGTTGMMTMVSTTDRDSRLFIEPDPPSPPSSSRTSAAHPGTP